MSDLYIVKKSQVETKTTKQNKKLIFALELALLNKKQ